MQKKMNYSTALEILRIIHDDKNNFYSERVKKLTAEDIVDVVNAYFEAIKKSPHDKLIKFMDKEVEESKTELEELRKRQKDTYWLPGGDCRCD